MKIAVLSDIHSNVFALQAVLNHIKSQNVDKMINLGDILYGPIAPKSTFELLMQHDMLTICGNQDRQLYAAAPQDVSANPTLQFVLDDLGSHPVKWLRHLAFSLQVDDYFLCHGTPTDDLIYLLEDIQSGYPHVRKDSEIVELLRGQNSPIILCGHTHLPRTIQLSTGQLAINPGSVGLPAYTDDEPNVHSMQNFSSHAQYAILEQHENGCNVQQICVSYDHQQAARAAIANGREDWAHYLMTGCSN